MSAALLQVSGVSKRFGGLQALSQVSMEIHPGTVTGIVGPNGAGKTTFFHVISGFYPPDAGTVVLDGEDLTGSRPHVYAQRGLARTFQITKPFARLTVLETVRIGALLREKNLAAASRAAYGVLERVGLAGRADVLGKELTVIQRKRLEVARALATQPRIILLDEVAAGLRPGEIREMVQLVRQLADDGLAVVMIEHVLEAVMSVSERIVVLSQGCKIAEDTPRNIVRNPAVVDAYFGEVVADA
jgi:branched-chain amino acid transport system ATP-binding protein